MAKRIKEVFSSIDQCVHVFAARTQHYGRAGNVFFSDGIFYSYGHHWPLAEFIEYNGQTIVLINKEKYSNTTSSHCSYVRSATRHFIQVFTDKRGLHNAAVREGLVAEQGELIDDIMWPFSKRHLRWVFHSDNRFEESVSHGIREFNDRAKLLGHRELQIDVPQDFIGVYNDRIKFLIARGKEINKKRDAEQAAEMAARAIRAKEAAELSAAQQAIDLEAWHAGGPRTNYLRDVKPEQIRIQGDLVQTTDGAEVPLDQALRLLRLIDQQEANRGDRVGAFVFNKIKGDLVSIGCHEISLAHAREILGGLL